MRQPASGPAVPGPGNFAFLAPHSPLLAELGQTAEKLFAFDPPSCVAKLRLLGEAITQDIAARIGVALQQPTQAELLRAVEARLGLDPQVRQLFHWLRRTGNTAVHGLQPDIGYREGLDALKIARELAVWFHRGFAPGAAGFKPGPFQLPHDPSQQLLQQRPRLADRQHAQARLPQDGRQLYEKQAAEPAEDLDTVAQRASQAATQVLIDEATTRQLIDQQPAEASCDTDAQHLTLAAGECLVSDRPRLGRHHHLKRNPLWPSTKSASTSPPSSSCTRT